MKIRARLRQALANSGGNEQLFLRECEPIISEIEDARTALRRIVSLDEKNVPKYAQQIAAEAL